MSAILGLLFSLCTFAATTGTLSWRSPRVLVMLPVFTGAFFGAYTLLEWALPEMTRSTGDARRAWGPFGLDSSSRSAFRNGMVIFLCWLPYLALTEGIMAWDSADQLGSYYGASAFGFPPGVIWNHHPAATTFLYGKFASLGARLFGSYFMGLTVLSGLQMLGGALAMAFLVRELVERQGASRLVKVLLVFVSAFPIFPITFMTVVKDSTNLVVFLWWLLCYARLVASRCATLRSPGFVLGFVALSLCCGLTKKTSLYVIVAALLLAAVLCRPGLRRALATAALTLSIAFVQVVVIEGALYSRLGVVPGDSQAAYTSLIQMVARVGVENPGAVGPEGREVFDDNVTGVTFEGIAEHYQPYTTDTLLWSPQVAGKGPESVSSDFSIGEFGGLFADLMLRQPGPMIRGFVCLESGWFSFVSGGTLGWPDGTQVMPNMLQPTFVSVGSEGTWGATVGGVRYTEGAKLVDGLYDLVTNIPGLNALFYNAVWTAVLPAFLLLCVLRRRSLRRFALLLPVFLSVAVLWLSPVSIQLVGGPPSVTRYVSTVVALVTVAPCLLAAAKAEGSCAKG